MPECMACGDEYSELHPLKHLECNDHHYCEKCFCRRLQLAIDGETCHPIPCGKKECPRLDFQDVRAILLRCTTIAASRRANLLQQYAHRLIEYNATNRTYCSKAGCTIAQGKRRFLDATTYEFGNGQRVRCPDCSTVTCTECKESVDPSADPEHVCDPNATGMGRYVASLPDSERWRWRLCGGCVLWGEKTDIHSCNHTWCEGCNYVYCFICDRKWTGISLCTHGCPKNGPVRYDADGYNQCGYHRVSGLSRDGVPRPRDALTCEANADSVAPRDANGHLIVNNGGAATESVEEAVIYDNTELANAGWDNGTLGEDGGANFLAAVNNLSIRGVTPDIDPDYGDDAGSEGSGSGDDNSMLGSVEDDGSAEDDDPPSWPGQLTQTWGFDNLDDDDSVNDQGVYYGPVIFPWPGQVVQVDDAGGDPPAEDLYPVADAWVRDADGFDKDGYDLRGLDRLGRDRKGLSPAEAIEALAREVHW